MDAAIKSASEIIYPSLPENDVQTFAWKHGLIPHIEMARRLVANHFSVSAATIQWMRDDEFLDEWVSLQVKVQGEMGIILDAYDAYTREFVANVPPDVVGKIRLSLETI